MESVLKALKKEGKDVHMLSDSSDSDDSDSDEDDSDSDDDYELQNNGKKAPAGSKLADVKENSTMTLVKKGLV